MIRFQLKCDNDHSFESWFASTDAFEKVQSAGMVACPTCGSEQVSKSLMAPQVSTSRKKAAEKEVAPLSAPASEVEAKLAAIKREVEKNSDYVGMSFASEARKMHDGDIPLRSIYGEAKPDEAKKLVEDGVPVAPLPLLPQRKTN